MPQSCENIVYTPGKLPTRNGMTLYYMPSHDSFAPALSETSTRGYDSASLRMEHIEPGDGSLRDSESVKTNCQRNFMRGRMRRAQRLLSPSPAEEYYRGQQIKILRKTCETICRTLLRLPLPKDLLDQCIFVETGSHRWWGNASDAKIPEEYADPIFPNCNPALVHKVLFRELFGDVIGRLIPRDKLGVPRKVIKAVIQTLEQSHYWLHSFLVFLRSAEGETFIRSRPSPLCFFENCLDAFQIPSYAAPCSQKMGTRADDPTDSKVMEPFASDFPSYCPSAWVWWVERAQGLVSDLSAQVTRYLDFLNAPMMSHDNVQVEKLFTSQSNAIVRNLLTAMYPVVYTFVLQAVRSIVDAIDVYRDSMRLFGERKNEETVVDSVSVLCRSDTRQRLRRAWDEEVVFLYKDDEVSCRRAHFEKYVRLLLRTLKEDDLMTAGSKSLANAAVSEEDARGNPECSLWSMYEYLNGAQRVWILDRIYVMLKRYSNVIYSPSHHTRGGNMHAAAPEKVFHYLKDAMSVSMECFASPNNCFFPHFFSAFPDTDGWFGSMGSFFDTLDFPSGAYEVGPPYTEEMLLFTIEHLEKIMSLNNDRSSLTFVVFVPDWYDCDGLKRMRASPWCTTLLEGPGNQHFYVVGTQHSVNPSSYPTRYYRPPHATVCFIFQNTEGRRVCHITKAVENHLRCRMQDRSDYSEDGCDMQSYADEKQKAKEKNAQQTTEKTQVGRLVNDPRSQEQKRCWWTLLTLGQPKIASFVKPSRKEKIRAIISDPENDETDEPWRKRDQQRSHVAKPQAWSRAKGIDTDSGSWRER